MTLQQQLTQEAKDKGFNAKAKDDKVIISLNRKVYKSEVIEALDLYDHEVFVKQDSNEVIIDLS